MWNCYEGEKKSIWILPVKLSVNRVGEEEDLPLPSNKNTTKIISS